MKTKIFTLLLVSLIYCVTLTAQTNTKNIDPVGSWKFDAPTAPEGYTSGTIIVGMVEKLNTASMSFTGSEYKIPGEKVKVENNTLSFIVYLEGETITVTLKIESAAKMSGKAVYSQGEVPLTLAKNPEKK